MVVVSLFQQGSPMRNGLWFKAKGCLFLPEEGGLAGLPFHSPCTWCLAQISLAGSNPGQGVKSMWTHSTWYHVAFGEFQSHMWPELRYGSHLVRPQTIEP